MNKIQEIKRIIEWDKLKFVWAFLSLFVFLLCFINSLKSQLYFDALKYFLGAIAICLFIENEFNKKLKRILSISYLFLTSVPILFAYSFIYSWLTALLYENYVELTGIINPMFINSNFLSNTLIFVTTIVLIYVIALLLILAIVAFSLLYLSILSFLNNINLPFLIPIRGCRAINILFFLLFVGCASYFVVDTYNDKNKIKDVIRYFLYNYSYYDNYNSGVDKCVNLSKDNIVKNNTSINLNDIKGIKIYPLFSEEKVSYVIKLNDKYIWKIADKCEKHESLPSNH